MNFKIIHTTDVHGYLYPTNYVSEQKLGLFSLYEQMDIDENTILLDGGDFIQGSAFAYYLAKNNQSDVISNIFNDVNYTAITPGNHEFNYGLEYLNAIYDNINCPIVCANLKGLKQLVPYTIKKIGDYSIGIIGFTTQTLDLFEKEENLKGIEILDIIETYQYYEEELTKKCDYIIVNYHGGCEIDIDDLVTPTEKQIQENEAISLFNTFKSIDLILTGHQHRMFIKEHDGRIITQGGSNGNCFIELDIDLETKKMIDGNIVQNFGLMNDIHLKYDKIQESVEKFLDQPLAQINEDILIRDHFDARINSHALVNFLHDVQFDVSGADISAVNLFATSIGFSKNITFREVLANYPFANSLVVLEVSKDDIIAALEVTASYFEIEDGNLVESPRFTLPKRQEYQYDLFSGFHYELDITKPVGSRVVFTDLEDRQYTICLNNYRASNFAWYPMYENKKIIKALDTSMIDVIVEYLTNQIDIIINKESNFKIIY